MGRSFNPLKTQNVAFLRARCQARYRREGWDEGFTFEVWWRIWEPMWHLRGSRRDDWQMIRIDITEPWSEDNVDLVCRRDWLREVNLKDSWCSRYPQKTRGRPKGSKTRKKNL